MQEVIEKEKEMQDLISKQKFTIGDAQRFLERWGNFAIKMDQLEKSRDKWRQRAEKAENLK